MKTPDVVVLVPGFLGFARFGGFYYFADRLIAVLRGLLEEPLGYAVPVIPVTTFPTDSLRKRQKGLLQRLESFCQALSGVERLHLIGHSTGGVDAQLLACTRPLYGATWDKKASLVRAKIRSVVTLSAPHSPAGVKTRCDTRPPSFRRCERWSTFWRSSHGIWPQRLESSWQLPTTCSSSCGKWRGAAD